MVSLPHKSINLLIVHDTESRTEKKLKKILPIIAGILFITFLIIFGISIIYNYINIQNFTALKTNVETYEKNIIDNKNIEQIYAVTAKRLDSISQILSSHTNVSPLFVQVDSLENSGIIINSSSVNEKGDVSLSLTASSAMQLEQFIDYLISEEEIKHIYSNIISQGVVRDKKGNFIITINFQSKIS
jgi:hypothetical protein